MYRSPSLIESYVSPEKGWMVFIGLLAAHRFSVSAIFCHDGPGGGRSCDVFRREPFPFRSDGQMQDSQISVRHCLNFGLQNTQGREIQQFQVQWIWQPICWSPEFGQELLGGPGSVCRPWIHWEMYSLLGYVLWTQGTTCCLKSSWLMLALKPLLAETCYRQPKSARPTLIPLASLISAPQLWHQVYAIL